MPDSLEIYQKRIHLAIETISQSIDQPIDLAGLADKVGFSPYHFSRIFTAVMGETPMKYVLRVRLEAAANLLIKTKRSVTQIAIENGFSSPSTFTRAFSRNYQCTPSEYRQKWGYCEEIRPEQVVDQRIQNPGFEIQSTRVVEEISFKVVYTATYGGYSRENINNAWNRLCKWASINQILNADTKVLGISLDDPFITNPNRCRYLACMSIKEDQKYSPAKFVSTMMISGGKFAVFNVLSKPGDLKYVYQTIFSDWLLKSGFQPANAFLYEVYTQLTDGYSEEKMKLQIHIPIEPIQG